MLKTRIIPVLFLMNGLIVRSEGFREFKVIGNPINQLARLNDWLADELVYIDITREGDYDLRRDDMKLKGADDIVGILRQISEKAFMPLTFGGRIRAIEDVDAFIHNGADKVIINLAWSPKSRRSMARRQWLSASMSGARTAATQCMSTRDVRGSMTIPLPMRARRKRAVPVRSC